jgi:hypothetical protein
VKLPVSPSAYDRYTEQQRSGVIERSFTDMQAQVTGLRWDDCKATFRPKAVAGLYGSVSEVTDLPGWAFINATATGGQATFQLSHAYAEGTPVRPHVHWCKATSASGAVEWKLQYRWHRIAETPGAWIPLETTTPVAESPDTNTADYQMISAFAEIPATDVRISNLLQCRLYRDPAGVNDTYAGDAIMLEFDVHIQIDDRGSYKLHSKR